LIYEKVRAGQTRNLQVPRSLLPLHRNIEKTRQSAFRTEDREHWAVNQTIDIGHVIFKVYTDRGTIVRARTVDYFRITPGAPLAFEQLWLETIQTHRAPAG